MPEIWNLYDRERKLTPETVVRGEPIPAGHYYLGAEAIVLSGDKILITQRHPDKPFGLMWEFTGGACQQGEDTLIGIRRELSEEIGVTVSDDELIFLGTTRYDTSFGDSYLLIRKLTVDDLTFQPEEVVNARLVSITELDRLCRDGVIVSSVAARWYRYRRKILSCLSDERGAL